MAEDNKPRFDIPWATLLPIAAALAGVLAQFKPLVSTRPPIPNTKAIDYVAAQDIDARLWQDPLAVALKAKSELDADLTTKKVPPSRVQRHEIAALSHLIQTTPTSREPSGRLLLLGVMLDSGPYTEQAESRLRARQAVLEGLSESNFVPVDGEHIGFATTGWPLEAKTESTLGEDGVLVIPWEECETEDQQNHAIVLWLPAANFNPRPLQAFASLVRLLTGPQRDQVDVKLIGPANSDGLQNMLREAQGWQETPAPPEIADALNGVAIISARATASAHALLGPTAKDADVTHTIENCLPLPKRLAFLRTITPDDKILDALLGELRERGVQLADKNATGKTSAADHIVILSEWDNKYGRSLASSFKEEAHAEDRGNQTHIRIHSYRYLHGIDGRLPGGTPPSSLSTAQKPEASASAAVREATEGLDQSDYLRRLAIELKTEELKWLKKDGRKIRAIGLLGSDVYDKLMILRALRPEFRDAVFFTNNYDAHFELRDEWEDVRNLVIASPFADTLPKRWQQSLAPFRDSNQTSMYTASLVATKQLLPEDITKFLAYPYLFEVGRDGLTELRTDSSKAPVPIASIGDQRWFHKWLMSDGVRWRLPLGGLAVFLMAAWISIGIVDRHLKGGGDWEQRIKRVLSSTAFWLVCGVPLIVITIAAISQQGGAAEEPLAFFSGVSVWPSEMLRLIALLLAIHFMIKAGLALRRNETEINEKFCLRPLSKKEKAWPGWRRGLRRWQTEHPEWLAEDAKFSAQEAWHAYLRRSLFFPRCIRIVALLALYLTFSLSLILLLGKPISPTRGSFATHFDGFVIAASAVGLMVLTFYVVDAIQLNSNLIRIFTRGVREWGKGAATRCGRVPPLKDDELTRYQDILFVAQRTEVVAGLIWYPLIVLTLMFVARSSFFDNWTWPLSLILIFTLNAAWALGSTGFLRRGAEELRANAISNLEQARLTNYSDPTKRPVFDELIAEIRGLKKGAFAPLGEQPFVRAVLFPSGGLGLLAVGQRLLDIF